MRSIHPRWLLVAVLLVYVVLGVLYAVVTPAWQAPDEPAHYNYVRYVAEQRSFPVLHPGDYPHGYLEQIKDARFPPGMSIDSIRYEFHQPPLYYALASVVFTVFGGALVALRLFSVLLGAVLIVVAYAVARRIFPGRPALALATAAFIAFLPQHLASVAQAGNDTLAELLLALALLQLVTWVIQTAAATVGAQTGAGAGILSRPNAVAPGNRLLFGILLGLILITKTTAYIAAPLAFLLVAWQGWRTRAGLGAVIVDLLWTFLPALLIAVPWYLRDVSVYGWPDFLGLRMHDMVVVGQTRTADFLSQHGWGGYLERLVTFTFDSFWGAFGWLSVFMDTRVYAGLALLCLIVAGGLVLHERYDRRPGALSCGQRYALRLLAVSALFSVLAYGWYNLQFVQHQGRYLFTALVPVGVAFGLGWDEALKPHSARRLAGLMLLAALVIAAWGILAAHNLPKWPVAMALAAAMALAVRPWLSSRLSGLLFALPYAALPLVALYGLFGAIVPQLAR